MKQFKFFQNKEPINYNVNEEMVLGMIEYCNNNQIDCVGYSHPFVVSQSTGINHKRIVITGIHKFGTTYRPYVTINYNVNSEGYGNIMNVSVHSLTILDDYEMLAEQYE
jgi:hypothetical protein